MPGIEQIQVNAAIGLTFGSVLRSVLRQDPDVIMVGEIRDEETAEMACRAALVGRLVLATVHANSAEGVPVRLQDLGVPKYLVEDVLVGVLGQRFENSDVCNNSRQLFVELSTSILWKA
jgi:general secretion pathway protein E